MHLIKRAPEQNIQNDKYRIKIGRNIGGHTSAIVRESRPRPLNSPSVISAISTADDALAVDRRPRRVFFDFVYKTERNFVITSNLHCLRSANRGAVLVKIGRAGRSHRSRKFPLFVHVPFPLLLTTNALNRHPRKNARWSRVKSRDQRLKSSTSCFCLATNRSLTREFVAFCFFFWHTHTLSLSLSLIHSFSRSLSLSFSQHLALP